MAVTSGDDRPYCRATWAHLETAALGGQAEACQERTRHDAGAPHHGVRCDPGAVGEGGPLVVDLAETLDEGEAAMLQLGAATHEHRPGTSFRVFLDPAGHPFCLCVD